MFSIFSNNQGCGYILSSAEELKTFEAKVERKAFQVGGSWLEPDQETTLDGHLSRPVRYLGAISKENNPIELIFFLGSTKSLFEEKHYFQCIFLVSSSRIFELFSPTAGRDFNFIKGIWK